MEKLDIGGNDQIPGNVEGTGITPLRLFRPENQSIFQRLGAPVCQLLVSAEELYDAALSVRDPAGISVAKRAKADCSVIADLSVALKQVLGDDTEVVHASEYSNVIG